MSFIFPGSGVEAPLWLPPLVAFAISFFTSMAGVSGAFLLLPFQVSFLNFTSPAVSPTNMIFNITGIPGGVYRYLQERRLVWPLTLTVIAGTLPGVVVGVRIRLSYLPEAETFKMFVGFVLLYISYRLFREVLGPGKEKRRVPDSGRSGDWRVETLVFKPTRLSFMFQGVEYRCSPIVIFLFSLIVGVIGGAYGIGGGAIVAPFFVAIYRLPVHAVAGATLLGTFTTSVAGVIIYQAMGTSPDWLLGVLFGLGGLAGMYLGAYTQRHVKAGWIKMILGVIVLAVAARYIVTYFVN